MKYKKNLIKNLILILIKKYNFVNIKFIKLFNWSIYKIYKFNKIYKFYNLITSFINFKNEIYFSYLILEKETKKNYIIKFKHCLLHLNFLNHNSILNKNFYSFI